MALSSLLHTLNHEWNLYLHVFRTDDTAEALNNPALVLWSIRVPRIAMSMLTGAALSVSGVIFQGLFRNPLVSPTILGVTSGANFGAALTLLYGGGSVALLETSSFVWGAIAVWITWQIGKKGDNSATTLVLAGVIVSSLFVAGLSYLKCKADPLGQLPAIIFWTMGSFNSVSWNDTTAGGAIIAAGLIATYLFRWGLNPMALGDEEALFRNAGSNFHALHGYSGKSTAGRRGSCRNSHGDRGSPVFQISACKKEAERLERVKTR